MKKNLFIVISTFFINLQAMHFDDSLSSLSITNQEKEKIKNWFENKNITWNDQDPKVRLLKTDQYIMITTTKGHAPKFINLSENQQRKLMIENGLIMMGSFAPATKEFQDITDNYIQSVD